MESLMKAIKSALSAGTLTVEAANTIIQKAQQILDMIINLQVDIENPAIGNLSLTQVETSHTLDDLNNFNPQGPWVEWTEIRQRSEALAKAIKMEDTVEALALALKVISMFGGI